MTPPRHRADQNATIIRRHTPTSDKVSVRLARLTPLPTRLRLGIGTLVLVAVGSTVGAMSEDVPDSTTASKNVTSQTTSAALNQTRARPPVVSRSMARRADPTVDVREYRVAQAIKRAEQRAARERRRARQQARAEARERARIAAEKAAAKQRAAEKVAARQAAHAQARAEALAEAQAAASTDPGTLRDMARQTMLDYGFGADQWTYLDQLIMRESGWNPHAQNASSGAYGLPQALPGSKMASAGPDWQTNPVTQVRWMLGYIAERYGNPQNAWAHSQNVGWY